MNILVFGGTGKISRSVVKCLIEKGENVWVLNRGSKENIQGVRHIKEDIRNFRKIKEKLKVNKFDIIIDFLSFNLEDLKNHINLFDYQIEKYIFISSATVYDTKSNIIVNERSKIGNSYSKYAQNKIKCEEFLNRKWKKEKYPILIIRPSHTFDDYTIPMGIHGKKGTWQNIERMLKGKAVIMHGDGNSLWTMTRSIDFAKWLTDIIMSDDNILGETFQITADESMTWNHIYDIIADELNVDNSSICFPSCLLAQWGKEYDLKASLLGDKSRSVIFDNNKLKKVSTYSPEIGMEQSIRNAVKNVLANPDLQQRDEEFDRWCDEIAKKYEQILCL